MSALPEAGAARAAHGTVTVEHHPVLNEVWILAHGTRIFLSDAQARDLTFALAALFPSMVREEAVDVARTHAAVERVQALADQLTTDEQS